MTVHKKNLKKNKKEKEKKSKNPGSKHKKTKDGKGKRVKKTSKNDAKKQERSKDKKKPDKASPRLLAKIKEKFEKQEVKPKKQAPEKYSNVKKLPDIKEMKVPLESLPAGKNPQSDSAPKQKEKKETEEKAKDKIKKNENEVKKSDKKIDEKPKEKEQAPKDVKENAVKTASPTKKLESTSTIPETKESNLYTIIRDLPDSKSGEGSTSPPKKNDEPITSETKTPESNGTPLIEVKKKESKKGSGKQPKEVVKKGSETGLKEGSGKNFTEGIKNNAEDGSKKELKNEMKNDEAEKKKSEKGQTKPVENLKSEKSDSKKEKSESFKLKKTQSLSPVDTADNTPEPPAKLQKSADHIMIKTPPLPKNSSNANLLDPPRSDLDGPLPESTFVSNHGDTKISTMDIKKVNLDTIGRTGMYLERCGMTSERKQAFDWIAFNRHDVINKQKDFSQNMAVALSDIGIAKSLLMRTVIFLKSHGQINVGEMDNVLKDIQAMEVEYVSFSQAAAFFRKHCECYKSPISKDIPLP